ncbi:MAG: tail fiber domain-containing protein [Muribaculum sp.]|nr:tail fiber domain-containing protein [Muribaculum sp.]
MNRILLFILTTFAIMSNASAQIVVNEEGQTRMGYVMNNSLDSSVSLNIWDCSKPHGGAISFGLGLKSMIKGDGAHGNLSLIAKNRFELSTGTERVLLFTPNLFEFSYNVQAPAFLTTSDLRLKSNVSSLDNAYIFLKDINSVGYNLSFPIRTDSLATKDSAAKATNTIKDDRLHFGFIAQEVKEIYPNLVVEDENGMLSIDYIGFIPLLVDAYKQLSERVRQQDEYIASIANQTKPSYMPASVGETTDEKAILKQNKPNPFNSTTTIECFIPNNINKACLCIYDLQGKQVICIDIIERGNVSTIIDGSRLTPGMFIYSLIADGQEIDSKRMILTD